MYHAFYYLAGSSEVADEDGPPKGHQVRNWLLQRVQAWRVKIAPGSGQGRRLADPDLVGVNIPGLARASAPGVV